MIEIRYEVYADGELYANNMSITTAVILVKALLNEYLFDEIIIRKMEM